MYSNTGQGNIYIYSLYQCGLIAIQVGVDVLGGCDRIELIHLPITIIRTEASNTCAIGEEILLVVHGDEGFV